MSREDIASTSSRCQTPFLSFSKTALNMGAGSAVKSSLARRRYALSVHLPKNMSSLSFFCVRFAKILFALSSISRAMCFFIFEERKSIMVWMFGSGLWPRAPSQQRHVIAHVLVFEGVAEVENLELSQAGKFRIRYVFARGYHADVRHLKGPFFRLCGDYYNSMSFLLFKDYPPLNEKMSRSKKIKIGCKFRIIDVRAGKRHPSVPRR